MFRFLFSPNFEKVTVHLSAYTVLDLCFTSLFLEHKVPNIYCAVTRKKMVNKLYAICRAALKG